MRRLVQEIRWWLRHIRLRIVIRILKVILRVADLWYGDTDPEARERVTAADDHETGEHRIMASIETRKEPRQWNGDRGRRCGSATSAAGPTRGSSRAGRC